MFAHFCFHFALFWWKFACSKLRKIQCEYLHPRCSPFVRDQFDGNKCSHILALKSIDSDGHFVPFIGFNHVSKNICLFLLLHNKVDQSEHEEYPLIHIFITNQYTFSKINCFLLFLELPNFLKPPPFKLKSSSAREENMSKVSLFWFFFFL